MPRSVKTQYVIDTLNLALDSRLRLKTGLKRRKELREKILNGDNYAADYRYKFMTESSDLVMALLRDLAADFDRTHTDDQCSNFDIHDILKIVIAKLGVQDD